MKKHVTIWAMVAVLLLAALAASPVAGAAQEQDGPQATHIIVFNDGVEANGAANALASAHGLTVNNIYTYALSGMAAVVPDGRLNALAKDPRVAYVEANQVVKAIEIPSGIDRTDADLNNTAAILGDGGNVNVDVAIIDTGIDLDHPDLNVYRWTNCARKGPFNTSCKGGDSGADDGYGHGTHVAGTVAALDNGDSVVGMAPGARLWNVKVLGDDGSGYMNWIIAGIDYVTANAAFIDVANMSLGCECYSAALNTALDNSVSAGVTYAVAAGNSAKDASTFSPANNGSVITVSAVADFDGAPGGLTDQTVVFSSCIEDTDDSFACFSNYGSDVEIAAPGVSILSTYIGGGTATMSGTSMASPHVAGAAALVKAANPTFTPAQVLAKLLDTARPNDYTGDPDGTVEPMLNVSDGPAIPLVLDTINVAPIEASVAMGQTRQFTATGNYTNGSNADVTASVVWSSDSVDASIDAYGLATGDAAGSAGISAALDGVDSNTAMLTIVPPPTLDSITVDPTSASVMIGETQQYTATGVYSDFSSADITGSVAWSSDSPDASIDASGMAMGVAVGSAGISASLEGVTSNTAALAVTAASEAATIVIVDFINYATSGGRNSDKNLLVTLRVIDDKGNPVDSASVSINLRNVTTGGSWNGAGSTAADGTLTFRLRNAPEGCYTTSVTNVTADGLAWDGASPGNSFCKASSNNGKANSGALQSN